MTSKYIDKTNSKGGTLLITINMNISIPFLWGTKTFEKNNWNYINVIVGPNGTGKSLLAEQIKNKLTQDGFRVRPLTAERLFGLEKQDYSYFGSPRNLQGINISEFGTLKSQGVQFGLAKDAFIILKERLNVRIKVESIISDIFEKNIQLFEEGGFLIPKIQDIKLGNSEYSLQGNECHGLKELITLLTFLYDDTHNCIILDEPELHLHPQFQSFFLNEMRKISGDPRIDQTKKLFFVVTHSTNFIDIKTIDDLKNIVVCHYNDLPTFIDNLSVDDELRMKKFIPRLNTYHKQFFFSPNPVFVEGYTDQQFFSIVYDKLGKNIAAAGSCIIDVGGKDELEAFYRLCNKLNLNARFIADLDTVFKGKLRQTLSNEEKAIKFIQEKGIGVSLSNEIGELENKLKVVADDLASKISTDTEIIQIINQIKLFKVEEVHKLRCFMLISIMKVKEKILNIIDPSLQVNINFICGRFKLLLQIFEKCNVYILEKGVVESYYRCNNVCYPNLGSKDKLFESEIDFLLSCDNENEIEQQYSDLLIVLKKCIPEKTIDINKHLKFVIIKWIQGIQWAVAKGEIVSLDTLKSNAIVQINLYGQIFEVIYFTIDKDKKFICRIKLDKSMDKNENEIVFNERTIAQEFNIN